MLRSRHHAILFGSVEIASCKARIDIANAQASRNIKVRVNKATIEFLGAVTLVLLEESRNDVDGTVWAAIGAWIWAFVGLKMENLEDFCMENIQFVRFYPHKIVGFYFQILTELTLKRSKVGQVAIGFLHSEC